MCPKHTHVHREAQLHHSAAILTVKIPAAKQGKSYAGRMRFEVSVMNKASWEYSVTIHGSTKRNEIGKSVVARFGNDVDAYGYATNLKNCGQYQYVLLFTKPQKGGTLDID